MPLIIRNIETHAEYEVADLDAFKRAYGDDPNVVIVSGLPVPVVLADDADESEKTSQPTRTQTTRVRKSARD